MNIAVVGVGTAGIMSLCHMLRWTNATVTSIYNPSAKILGIGESMDPSFLSTLYEGSGFLFLEDAKELDATLKLGVTWKNWRPIDFNAYMSPPAYGVHFNNFNLKDYCFKRFKDKWNNRFKTLKGNVSHLKNIGDSVSVVVNDVEYNFDYVIDCRGFPKDLTEYQLVDLPVNHCLVNVINEPGDWNTTICQAHSNGWMFGIPLQTRQGWGYLYNDIITTKEDAIKDIERIFKKSNLSLNEFSFKSYYTKTFFDGRILKNGNSALFYEPIEALSGFFYSVVLRYLIDYLNNRYSVDRINDDLIKSSKELELFINYLYHGGSTFDSEFWKIIKKKTTEKLTTDQQWQKTISDVKNSLNNSERVIGRWSIEHWLMWDRNLNYNYFTK